jgi:hypothetical protein
MKLYEHEIKTETSLFSLSISFENVDPAKKKLPVHILDGVTLSYKVSMLLMNIYCY